MNFFKRKLKNLTLGTALIVGLISNSAVAQPCQFTIWYGEWSLQVSGLDSQFCTEATKAKLSHLFGRWVEAKKAAYLAQNRKVLTLSAEYFATKNIVLNLGTINQELDTYLATHQMTGDIYGPNTPA